MKKLLGTLALTMLLIMSMSLPAFAVALDGTPEPSSEAEDRSIAAYNILLDYFGRDEEGFPTYPEYFGGAYLDGEQLVFNLKEGYEQWIPFLTELVAPNPLKFDTVAYSYNELWELGKEYVESLSVDWVYYGVSQQNNCFTIALNKEDENAVSLFHEGIATYQDIPIEFTLQGPMRIGNPQEEEFYEPASTYDMKMLIGGSHLDSFWMPIPLHFSLGICGTWKGIPAILTAGHPFQTVPSYGRPIVSMDGLLVGTLDSFTFGPYGKGTAGDWALIFLEQGVEELMTNQVYANERGDTYNLRASTMTIPEG